MTRFPVSRFPGGWIARRLSRVAYPFTPVRRRGRRRYANGRDVPRPYETTVSPAGHASQHNTLIVMEMVHAGMTIGRARCPQRAVRRLTDKPPYQSNANMNSIRHNNQYNTLPRLNTLLPAPRNLLPTRLLDEHLEETVAEGGDGLLLVGHEPVEFGLEFPGQLVRSLDLPRGGKVTEVGVLDHQVIGMLFQQWVE